MQGAQVRALVRELDPAFHKDDPAPKAQHSQINKWYCLKITDGLIRGSWELPVAYARGCSVLSRARLCDPTDCSSSVHGILQARTLEWVAISSSRGPSPPGDWVHVSCTAGRFFTTEVVYHKRTTQATGRVTDN